MKEHPILFTDPMVRAILGGAKTQTRRLVKPKNGQYIPPSQAKDPNGWMQLLRECPYGRPGDRLWVREAFALSVIDPDGLSPEDDPENYDVIYRADPEQPGGGWADSGGNEIPAPWKPSIHMPRWASRILLEITAVRVERLQECSEEDAQAEGIQRFDDFFAAERLSANEFRHMAPTAVESYALLWNAINGPGSWLANPWVWVIEFMRVEVE